MKGIFQKIGDIRGGIKVIERVTIQKEGSIVLPIEVLQRLKIHPGETLIVEDREEGILLKPSSQKEQEEKKERLLKLWGAWENESKVDEAMDRLEEGWEEWNENLRRCV